LDRNYLSLAGQDQIDELYPYLDLPGEWIGGLLELGAQIRRGDGLGDFFIKACRYFAETGENPDFSDWPDPVVKGIPRPDFYIFLSLLAVRTIREVHGKMGIPEEITRETCRGVGTKSRDYFFFAGVPGTVKRAIYWFLHPMGGVLFKIGRFEYMLRKSSEVHESFPEKLGGDPWVLDMHIPGGGAMTWEACRDSWIGGLNFFGERFPDRPAEAVVCVSWIFSPDLPLFLPSDSHLVRLQERVSLYPVSWSEREGVPFIMGTSSENPEDWPERTSLQRAYKGHILGGGKVRTGAMFIGKPEILDNLPR